MYTPNPMKVDISSLPSELLPLVEQIAREVHERWAKERIADGWKYGEVRDDAAKTTPCLVPYEELPEVEKEYDRKTALQTIGTVLSLGYTIEKK